MTMYVFLPNIVFQLERGEKNSISSFPNHFITSARISWLAAFVNGKQQKYVQEITDSPSS